MAHRTTPQQVAAYRVAAERRRQQREARVAARRRRAWQVAHTAAEMLRSEFGAGRVVAFGSLASAGAFHERSDVDPAVWGLAEASFYRAVGRAQGIDPAIPVDVVRAEEAPPWLRPAVDAEGVDL